MENNRRRMGSPSPPNFNSAETELYALSQENMQRRHSHKKKVNASQHTTDKTQSNRPHKMIKHKMKTNFLRGECSSSALEYIEGFEEELSDPSNQESPNFDGFQELATIPMAQVTSGSSPGQTPDYDWAPPSQMHSCSWADLVRSTSGNIRHAASLDNLPESIVEQSHNIEDICAICLEVPITGEAIRHLPCIHKFHKYCVDRWLGMNNFCPVCKFIISTGRQ